MNIRNLISETLDSFHISKGLVSHKSLTEPNTGDRVRHKEHGRTGVVAYRKQHGNTMVVWDGDTHKCSVRPENLEHETPKHQVANDV